MEENKRKDDEALNENLDNENLEDSPAEEIGEEKLIDENSIKISELENEISQIKDKYLRTVAEFQNYKRRTENDQLNIFKYAGETFITKLLPVVDDFERSLQHMSDAKDVDSIKKGVQMVYDKLMKVFDDQGVKKIESVGEPFDVNYHEALMQRKDDSKEPHTVLEELEKGYMYKDKVIRHSKVIVNEE